MASSAGNIKIEPVNVTWAIEEQATITAVADVAASLDGTFFKLSDTAGTVGFWIDVDDSGTLIPAGASALDRAIEITTISTGDSASVIAGLLATAISADSKFGATSSGSDATVTSTDAADIELWADGDTGFTFTLCQEGGSLDLGLLDGDVADTFEEVLFDVTSHQTGVTPIAALRQGMTAEVTTTLLETTSSKLEELFAKAGGGSVTPGGGTKVFGWGSSRQGTNAFIQARRLILKPVNATTDLDNLTFWKAYPQPGSLVFSGENPKTLEVSWKIFRDENRAAAIDFFVFGDQTQATL